MVRLQALIGSHELYRNPRLVRQLVEAMALSKRVASPSQEIPEAWLPQLEKLAEARATGASWAAALEHAGLQVPDVASVHLELEGELAALWEALPGLIGRVLIRLPSYTQKEVLEGLKDLLE